MHVLLHMAVIPEGAGGLRRELIGEAFAGHHLGVGHAGHAIHVPALGQAVEVDGVGEIVGVVEGHLHPVALLHPQGGAGQAGRGAHGAPQRRIDPEGHELAGIDLLLHFSHFEAEMHLRVIALRVDLGAEFDGVVLRPLKAPVLRLQPQPLRLATPQIGVGGGVAARAGHVLGTHRVVSPCCRARQKRGEEGEGGEATQAHGSTLRRGLAHGREWGRYSAAPSGRRHCHR